MTDPERMHGHAQSILTGIKQIYMDSDGHVVTYDKRQLFELSDGGQIYLDFKLAKEPRPMLFLITGVCSDNQAFDVHSLISEAFERRQAYNICMISWRGYSGAKMVTPKVHNALTIDDIREPINHVFKKYCKPHGQRAYAVGCSMGATVLANALGFSGDKSVLSGAVCINAIIDKTKAIGFFDQNLGGFYCDLLGKKMFEKIRENIDMFRPIFEERNIDLEAELDRRFKSGKDLNYFAYHELITANMPQERVIGIDDMSLSTFERGSKYID